MLVPTGKLLRDGVIYDYERFNNVLQFDLKDIYFNNDFQQADIVTLRDRGISLVKIRKNTMLDLSYGKQVKESALVFLIKDRSARPIEFYHECDKRIGSGYTLQGGSAIIVGSLNAQYFENLNIFSGRYNTRCMNGLCEILSDGVFIYNEPGNNAIRKNIFIDDKALNVKTERSSAKDLYYHDRNFNMLNRGDIIFGKNMFLNLYDEVIGIKRRDFGVADREIGNDVRNLRTLQEITRLSYKVQGYTYGGNVYGGTNSSDGGYICSEDGSGVTAEFRITEGSCFDRLEFEYNKYDNDIDVGLGIGASIRENRLMISNYLKIHSKSLREMRLSVPICAKTFVLTASSKSGSRRVCIPAFELYGPAYNTNTVYRYGRQP